MAIKNAPPEASYPARKETQWNRLGVGNVTNGHFGHATMEGNGISDTFVCQMIRITGRYNESHSGQDIPSLRCEQSPKVDKNPGALQSKQSTDTGGEKWKSIRLAW